MKKGIDISSWQGNLSLDDWKRIKEDGIEFAIIRCAFTSYSKSKNQIEDGRFENNYNMAKTVGIPVGTYFYSCATTTEEAVKEAEFVLNLIKDKQFEYPVYYDVEDSHDTSNSINAPINQIDIGKEKLTEIVKTFCNKMEENNYYVGIYASTYWFNNYMILNDLRKYDKWVAQWSSKEPTIAHGMWQYTSTGSVDGIYGNVDENFSKYDYELIIKDNGLNGYIKPEIPVEPEVPQEPETPVIPEIPVEPEVPQEPETPVIPEIPVEPDINIDGSNIEDIIENYTNNIIKEFVKIITDFVKRIFNNIVNMFKKR